MPEPTEVSEVSDASDREELIAQNIAVFQRWFDAANAGDHEARWDIYHPDIVHELPWTLPPFPKRVQGLENLMAFNSSVPKFGVSPNFHDIDIHAFADDPYELVATYKSNWQLANGKSYTNDYFARARVQDGKLITFIEWPDPLRLLIALGGSYTLPQDGQPEIVHGADEAAASS
jgi:uncharacterized protein